MVKRKKNKGDDAPEEDELVDGGDEAPQAPAKNEGRQVKKGRGGDAWKSVELDMDILKEFESSGGMMIEEADEADIGFTYADGRKIQEPEPMVVKKKQTQEERKAERNKVPVKPKVTLKPEAPKKAKLKKKKEIVEEVVTESIAEEKLYDSQNIEQAEKFVRCLRKKLRDVDALKLKLGDAEPSQEQKVKLARSEDLQAQIRAAEAVIGTRVASKTEEAIVKEKELGIDMQAWTPYELHPALLANMARLGFKGPTHIQARCLMPAIRQRKDLVGAAETGSGKTLAFGLPILHHTLQAYDGQGGAAALDSPDASGLRGLIILPTRELAVQVKDHLLAAAQATPIRVECVVGGMAIIKQKRLLGRRPQVVVGTPGRIFALLGLSGSAGEAGEDRCDWFKDGLQELRHLVLDEADRLVESGHFKELDRILSLVYQSLLRPQQLQTMVFSATLTLDVAEIQQKGKGKGKGKGNDEETEGKIVALFRRLQFREGRAVTQIDLTCDDDAEGSAETAGSKAEPSEKFAKPKKGRGTQLPDRLTLLEAMCSDDKDREGTLAMWLLQRYRWNAEHLAVSGKSSGASTNNDSERGQGGRVLLFVNAISSCLRLTSILSLLLESPSAEAVLRQVRMATGKARGAPPGCTVEVLGLHSRMRQKDRLKRMEKFRASNSALLVCTDVAARGLDVPDVAAVLHYQAPRNTESFIHRSGRTARAGRSGECVIFMGPGDSQQWSKLYKGAGVGKDRLEVIDATSHEFVVGKEVAKLAADLESQVHKESKKRGDESWMRRTAEEADLPFDESEDDADAGKAKAVSKTLWPLYQELLARVRRPPRRMGAGPLSRAERTPLKHIK